MKKQVASLAIAATLLGGGTAGALLLPTVASAQEEEAPVEQLQASSLSDALETLVDNGVLTDEQAEAVEAAIQELRPAFQGPRHRGSHFGEAVTETLGMEPAEIREGLADGQTLAEIAEANGSSADALIDAMVAEANEHIDEQLEAGRITEEQAEEMRANAEERVTDRVNGEAELRRRGFGPPRGPGAFGPDGDTAEDADTADADA